MSELRSELRRRLRSASTQEILGIVSALEQEVEGLKTDAERIERLLEIGSLCEEIVPDRARALAVYERAAKLAPKDPRPLSRGRKIYQELGSLEMVVDLAEKEMRLETDAARRAELCAEMGEALIDLGEKDRAAEVLAQAAEGIPDSMRVRDALAAAQYDSEDWLSEAERLGADADKKDSSTASRMCLRAARILHIEVPEDPAFEQMLQRVLSFDPQNESANTLLETLLAKGERWDDLAAHHEKRAFALDESDRALAYRRFALRWLQRFKSRDRAADLFAKAVTSSLEDGAWGWT